MKNSDFLKCHGYKIIVIVIMLVISAFWFINAFTQSYSFLQHYYHETAFYSNLVACFLMLIPPAILTIHIIRRRNDKFNSYGSNVSDAVVAVVKIFGFVLLYALGTGLLTAVAIVIPTLLYTEV